METLNSILATIDGYVWNIPLIFPLLFVGILLTVRLGCMQITRLPRAIRFVWHNEKKGAGEVSSFGALCTALAATIGTGNIVGGPFYYIESGLKERFGWNMKWLASMFAVFGIGAGLLGIGTITQVNGITSAMARLTPNAPEFINIGGNSVSWTTAIAGFFETVFAATFPNLVALFF